MKTKEQGKRNAQGEGGRAPLHGGAVTFTSMFIYFTMSTSTARNPRRKLEVGRFGNDKALLHDCHVELAEDIRRGESCRVSRAGSPPASPGDSDPSNHRREILASEFRNGFL